MTERTSGLHRLITVPRFYAWVQRFLSGAGAHARVAELVFQDLEGKRVLEIGCGPGTWAPYLDMTAGYTGVDWNPRHIDTATDQHGSDRVRFVCGDIADNAALGGQDRFDAVIGMGILHHLDDTVARKVLARAADLLEAGGRYIGVEPVLHPRQNPVARVLKALDSGQNIRGEHAYRELFGSEYAVTDTRVRTDLIRVPYSHCLISASVN